jgi:hypothetical protein
MVVWEFYLVMEEFNMQPPEWIVQGLGSHWKQWVIAGTTFMHTTGMLEDHHAPQCDRPAFVDARVVIDQPHTPETDVPTAIDEGAQIIYSGIVSGMTEPLPTGAILISQPRHRAPSIAHLVPGTTMPLLGTVPPPNPIMMSQPVAWPRSVSHLTSGTTMPVYVPEEKVPLGWLQ